MAEGLVVRTKARGFSYVVVMFLVAVVAIASVRAMEVTITSERRSKEAELLWVGNAYRNAIRTYYDGASGSNKTYPAKLEELLYDGRLTRPTRPLRKLYRDPVSGSTAWGIVKDQDGAVIGVYSLAKGKPIKRAGFPPELASFANANSYSDWKFVYKP